LFRVAIHAGAAPWLAAASSYPIAAAVHFLYNRRWTFQHACDAPIAPQAGRYAAVVTAGALVTVTIVAWLTDAHLAPFAAKLIAVAVVSPLAFCGHKYLTYRAQAQRRLMQFSGSN